MLVQNSQKHQPEFDLLEARRVYREIDCAKHTGGSEITSPYHLFCVETIRDRSDLRRGREVPTDGFVFGKGEPPRRDCTQIGGKPFWPATREWPIDDAGNPYQFFAQINFADSTDFVRNLPGELLLMFVGVGDDWYFHPMQVRFEWVSLNAQPAAEFDPSLIANTGGPFFGGNLPDGGLSGRFRRDPVQSCRDFLRDEDRRCTFLHPEWRRRWRIRRVLLSTFVDPSCCKCTVSICQPSPSFD